MADELLAPLPPSLEPLFERLERMFEPSVVARIRSSMIEPKRTAYYLNPLVAAGFEAPGEPVAGLDRCYSVGPSGRAALLAHPGHATGAIYPMNPSSALAAQSMDLDGVSEVLDLAAAPGGKTLLMAAALGNAGRIAAVEPVKARFHRLRANLERCGVRNAVCYLSDGRSIGRKVPARFERVLLDAPCSSEARVRIADPATWRHWKPRKIQECARKQRGLIRSAFAALRAGGELTYCTCSFAPEENELVVAYLLDQEPAAELLPLPSTLGRPGLTSWAGAALPAEIGLTRRVLPDDLWDGLFLARLRKRAA